MDEIRIRLKIAEIVSGKYAGRVLRRRGFPLGFFMGFLIAIFVSIFASGFIVRQVAPGVEFLEAFTPLAVGMVVAFAMLRYRGRRRLDEVREAPLNREETELWVDAEGIHTASTGAKSSFAWSHILDVIGTKDAILVLLTPVQYLAIPHAKLPEGVSPQQAMEMIQGWRGAHPFT